MLLVLRMLGSSTPTFGHSWTWCSTCSLLFSCFVPLQQTPATCLESKSTTTLSSKGINLTLMLVGQAFNPTSCWSRLSTATLAISLGRPAQCTAKIAMRVFNRLITTAHSFLNALESTTISISGTSWSFYSLTAYTQRACQYTKHKTYPSRSTSWRSLSRVWQQSYSYWSRFWSCSTSNSIVRELQHRNMLKEGIEATLRFPTTKALTTNL